MIVRRVLRSGAAVLATSVWCGLVCPAASTHVDEKPSVTFSLSKEVFVGEVPDLTITVTAPANKALMVVKQSSAHRRLKVVVTDSKGNRFADSQQGLLLPETPKNFLPLEAGKSLTLRGMMAASLPAAGEYRVTVGFRPTDRFEDFADEELTLTVLPLTDELIAARTPVRPEASQVEKHDPVVELLVVRTGAGHTLFYRKSRADGRPSYLYRLWPIDGAAKPEAEVVSYERGRSGGLVRVTYTEGGKPVVGDIQYTSGSVIKPPQPVEGPEDKNP